MERRVIQVKVSDNGTPILRDIEVVVNLEGDKELVGVILSCEDRFYSDHGILELLYLPELVEYLGSSYESEDRFDHVSRLVEDAVESIGMEFYSDNYYLESLFVEWVPIGEAFAVVGSDYEGDSECIVIKSIADWIEPV